MRQTQGKTCLIQNERSLQIVTKTPSPQEFLDVCLHV